MQHGEKPDESAARELFEEVRLDAKDPRGSFTALGKMRLPYRDGVHFLYAYLYLAASPRVTIRQPEEVMGIMMLTQGELKRLFPSCTYDSQIAFNEILRRARQRGLLKA